LKEDSRKIVVLQGPAASGKSTWLCKNASSLYECVVADVTFTLLKYFRHMAQLARKSGYKHTFRVIRICTPLDVRLSLDQKRAEDQTSGRDALPKNVHERMEKQNSNLTDAMIKEVLYGCNIEKVQFVDNSSGGGAKAD
jgi:hypothetical protein